MKVFNLPGWVRCFLLLSVCLLLCSSAEARYTYKASVKEDCSISSGDRIDQHAIIVSPVKLTETNTYNGNYKSLVQIYLNTGKIPQKRICTFIKSGNKQISSPQQIPVFLKLKKILI